MKFRKLYESTSDKIINAIKEYFLTSDDARLYGPIYILPDGISVSPAPKTGSKEVLNHADFEDYLYSIGLSNNRGSFTGDASPTLSSLGAIRCSDIEEENNYIELSKIKPSYNQYQSLYDWLLKNKYSQVAICTPNMNDFVIYDLDDVDYIINRIKRYYSSGRLYEDYELNEVYPNKGESKEDFISRFMKATAKEYPDRKQRYAVALSYWNRRNKNKNLSESILETDSKGNTLSDEQLMYFKNSKIRDSSGNLQIMLHGTNKGEFPYFRCEVEPQFFTKDYDTAYEYSLPRDDGKDVESLIYNVYLNIEKPFDLSTKRQKDILIDFLNKKNINKFSKDQIDEMSRVPFTVADDLYSYLKQNFRNEFDGLIVDEGTSYKEGSNLDKTTSYVPFYSYQIKRISNKKPTRSVYIDK